MRVIGVLSTYDAKRYNSPPSFTASERRRFFKVDDEIRMKIEAIKSSASILSWQHVNMLGAYDFSNLANANDDYVELMAILNFKEVG